MTSTESNDAFGAELGGERVADPLNRGEMTARGNKGRDFGSTQQGKVRVRLSGRPAPVRAPDATHDGWRKRSVVHPRTSEREKSAKQLRLGGESVS